MLLRALLNSRSPNPSLSARAENLENLASFSQLMTQQDCRLHPFRDIVPAMNHVLRCDQIESQLIEVGRRVSRDPASSLHHPAQRDMPEWSGADVRITSDFIYEPQFMESHDLFVRTQHAVPLTWLFLEVRDAFGDFLDASNKYGFYGSLGQAAMNQLAATQPEPDDPGQLLCSVLDRAFDWLHVLRDEGAIPPNSDIVIHSSDTEGRQIRIDPKTGRETN
jgi:hypothetical protein